MSKDLKLFINGEMWQTSVRLREVEYSPAKQYEQYGNAGAEGRGRSINWVNQRRHERKKCNLIVEFTAGSQMFRDKIKDLSKGGAFIETKQKFEPEQEITILIQTPAKSIKRKGIVCRVMHNGIGVSFKNTQPVSIQKHTISG